MIDLGPPPLHFPKPAIIRAASADLLRPPIAGLLPGLPGPLLGFRHIPRLEWVNSGSSGADNTTYDFGNFVAPRAGLMIVGAAGRATANRTVGSVSIGGTNGTIHVNPSGGPHAVAIASRLVSAGNNNVSVTFSAGMVRAACFVWLLTNYKLATPTATGGVNDGSSGTSVGATFTIPIQGIAIYVNTHHNTNGTAWSAASEQADLSVESLTQMAGAHRIARFGAVSHTETASWTGSNEYSMCGAAWH